MVCEPLIAKGLFGTLRAMHTAHSNPELFRTEVWSPPKGAKAASWTAIMAGAALGPLISGLLGLSMARELPFSTLLLAGLIGALLLQILVLRRGGATTKLRWSNSNVMRIFGPIEIHGTIERAHFVVAAVLPTALLLLLLAGYLAVASQNAVGIAATVLIGAGLGVVLKQLLYAALALKRPRGTLIEELDEGAVRFHEPTSARL